jgi:hypothetical protein
MDQDTAVRAAVYDHVVETTHAPTTRQTGERTGLANSDVRESYRRLFARRTLVLAPDGETIIMAPPFSGRPTQHRVRIGSREYFANCAWDALGIVAAIKKPAVVTSRCEQTLEPLVIAVDENGPAPVECVAHFAVPAAHWWQNIVFT